jgi:fibronectin type 3 domain-containing protein
MNLSRSPRPRVLSLSVIAAAYVLAQTQSARAGFTKLTHANNIPGAQALLLTDGSVVVQYGLLNGTSNTIWKRLTPDSSGSYVTGNWTSLNPSTTGRLYGPSWVLRDGTVFVAGGEYINGDPNKGGDHNTAEIFDPTKNPNANGTPGLGAWSSVPASPLTAGIGDTGTAMLADGRVLIASFGSSDTALFDFTHPSSPWTSGPNLLSEPNGDEASWQLLPDGTILDDMRSPAEKYVPAAAPGMGSWVQITLPNTTPPIQLRNDPSSNEIGAMVLLPNGQVWCIGATGQTAYYTPGASPSDPGFFQPGPNLPGGDVVLDCPAALMPNGKVLLLTQNPTTGANTFREFDWRFQDTTTGLMGTWNTTPIAPPPGLLVTNPSVFRFVNLPSGEILFTAGQMNAAWTYVSDDMGPGSSSDWRPQIYSILGGWTFNPPLADGVYRLTGTQLNGLSYGSSYGDEGQSATNYPIVELRSRTTGQAYFARTFNFSTMGVQTGNSLQTADFTLPPNLPPDTYDAFVETNGTASDNFGFYDEVITESPWGVSPIALPGREEAENFDFGGNAVAYNVGAAQGSDNYRSTPMNIVPSTDTGGGWEVDSLRAGEWINYTVNKLAYGPQTLAVRVSSAVATAKFHFELITSIVQDYPRIVTTEAITPTISVPNTGGAGHWTTLTVPIDPELSLGEQTVRLVVDTAGVNFNWFGVTPTPPNGVVGAPTFRGVTLNWFISPGATSFNIYRSTTSGGEGTTPYKTGVTNNTFTDTAVTNGTTYYYTVAALSADGATSLTTGGPLVQSSEAAVTPSGPPAPTGVIASPIDSEVDISWNVDPSAIYYNVLRGTTPGGEAATPIFSYQYGNAVGDTGVINGTTYYYKVVAVSATGTSYTEVSAKPIPAPPPPTNVTASGAVNQVTVSWQASATATDYNVYRTTTPSDPNSFQPVNGGTNVVGTSFVDTTVTNGTTYYYRVTGNNPSGEGQPSNVASATPGVTAPNPPTNLAATAGIGKVTLSWTASSGATSYNLYRGTAANGESTTKLNTAAITTTSYVDTTGTVGTKYYYKATAVNSGGVESTTKSNEASATPTAAAAPTNLTATGGAGKVTLNWTASTGATGYYVYRGTATGQESATALNTTALTTTTYVDAAVTAGTTYFYKTSAIPAAPGTPPKSNEASAAPTGAPPNPPTNLTATPGVGQMSLSWTASTGATSYKIYRSTTAGNETLVTTPTITGTTYVDVPIIAGTKYYYKATAVNSGGVESTTKSNEASATPTSNPGIKINAGGGAASPFVADVDFDNAGSVSHANTIDVSGVTNPAPAAVYQSAHTTTTATPYTYTIPGFAPNSSHTVRLHFCETYFTSANQRVFDVTLNGTVVLPSFDIWVQAGNKQNKAVAKSFTVNANSNGAYIITFKKDTNSAWVSGIEVN